MEHKVFILYFYSILILLSILILFLYFIAEFLSNVDIKPPPVRCECGSFNCKISSTKCECECGSFRINISSTFYLLISICVMLPPRLSDQSQTQIQPVKQRRRSLFSKNNVSESKKSLNEELICWIICSSYIPLSKETHFGLFDSSIIIIIITY